MGDLDHVFQKLCHEAVVACGTDVPAIERYVLERIGAMDAAQRARLQKDIDRVLGFRAPAGVPGEPH